MFLVIWLMVALAAASPITSLPNYIGPALSMDSGYVTVNAAGGRAQFYWLIRSTSKPSTDPVVFWFQGITVQKKCVLCTSFAFMCVLWLTHSLQVARAAPVSMACSSSMDRSCPWLTALSATAIWHGPTSPTWFVLGHVFCAP